MAKTPRERAEACFAVARSTVHKGEREAANGRGTAICKRFGLDLDDFDIPGRVRTRPTGGMRDGVFHIDITISQAAKDDLNRQFADIRRAMEGVQRAARKATDRCQKCGAPLLVLERFSGSSFICSAACE